MNDASDPKTDRHIKDLISEDPYSHVTAATPPFFMTQGTEDGIIGAYHGISQAERMFHRLGDRAQDQLLICPGYEHGFAFDAPCTITALRSWFVKTLGL